MKPVLTDHAVMKLNGSPYDLLLENLVGNKKVTVGIKGRFETQETTVDAEELGSAIALIMPLDRANEILGEFKETMISKGKAYVEIEAKNDIKRGEKITFLLDVSKYVDSNGKSKGVRMSNSGFIF